MTIWAPEEFGEGVGRNGFFLLDAPDFGEVPGPDARGFEVLDCGGGGGAARGLFGRVGCGEGAECAGAVDGDGAGELGAEGVVLVGWLGGFVCALKFWGWWVSCG
jgi:hypothetical protein